MEEMSVSLQARFSNVGGYGIDDRASSIRGVMINLHSDDEKLDLHMNTGSTGVFENFLTFGMVGQANRGIIKPSKMEVAPLHRTVDITQKRVLFKNTKKTKKRY